MLSINILMMPFCCGNTSSTTVDPLIVWTDSGGNYSDSTKFKLWYHCEKIPNYKNITCTASS